MTAVTDHEHATGPIQIGALAKATGLTVRTLHHYDAIGLGSTWIGCGRVSRSSGGCTGR